jgi:D-xylose transport system permease protein
MSSEIIQESAPPTTQQAEPPPPSLRTTILRFLRGNLGPLPVILTLILIGIFFQVESQVILGQGYFLTTQNLNNLALQIATLGILGLASALVLFIGEIDLSLGVVSYLTASVSIIYSVFHHVPTIPAILIGLGVGAAIGLGNGIFVAVLRVPSFIVTLAGLLIYQGVVIQILFPQTSLNISDPNLNNLSTSYFADPTDPNTPFISYFMGIGLPLIAVALYAVGSIYARIQRQRRGLAVGPMWTTVLRVIVAIGLVVGILFLFEGYFGIPQSTIILMGLLVLFWLILRFTAFGRHVYAVGGNAEAARRAGINVTGMRITIFILASTLAAVGGLLLASRSGVATAQVNPNLLLNAIATAVIGGVSLFGGRGSVWGILLGALVLGAIENGMALLGQKPQIVFIVEGLVLVLAVTIDSLARNQAVSVGEWGRAILSWRRYLKWRNLIVAALLLAGIVALLLELLTLGVLRPAESQEFGLVLLLYATLTLVMLGIINLALGLAQPRNALLSVLVLVGAASLVLELVTFDVLVPVLLLSTVFALVLEGVIALAQRSLRARP